MYRRGHILNETYKVEESLNPKGGRYLVVHSSLEAPYVVQVFADHSHAEELDSEEKFVLAGDLARKKSRLKQLAQLQSGRLARVVDSFEEDDRYFLVRELVEGLSLRELIDTSLKPLRQDTTEEILEQLLGLLEELQNLEPPLVLGCLAPDNILIDPEGRVTLVDFRLGLPGSESEGVNRFRAPEELSGGETDLRSDFYSLGALAYFLVTGIELPPVWSRITEHDTISNPLELNIQVDSSFWDTVLSLTNLNRNLRPESVDAVREMLRKAPSDRSREASPATWYPEQSDLILGDSYPYRPFNSYDWTLKMVQAAVIGRARKLDIRQTRESCRFEFAFAEPDVPSPRDILDALTGQKSVEDPAVNEIACGLRMAGEFQRFILKVDDWRRAWYLKCDGGKLTSRADESTGMSGLSVEVAYVGRSSERAKQRAEEYAALCRSTRLCPVPITIDKRPLEPGRPVDPTTLSKDVEILYLASVTIPNQGDAVYTSGPAERKPPYGSSRKEKAYTVFSTPPGAHPASHIDLRCFVSPGESKAAKKWHRGYHFLRRPSRVLWYRRGVLCGEQFLEKKLALQLDIHLNGENLAPSSSGLTLELPERISGTRLKPLGDLPFFLPLIKMRLDEYWEENPVDTNAKTSAVAGGMGAPLLLMYAGAWLNPGLLLLKKALLLGAVKASSLAGGVMGYRSATNHEDQVRKTCLKAFEAFETEGIG